MHHMSKNHPICLAALLAILSGSIHGMTGAMQAANLQVEDHVFASLSSEESPDPVAIESFKRLDSDPAGIWRLSPFEAPQSDTFESQSYLNQHPKQTVAVATALGTEFVTGSAVNLSDSPQKSMSVPTLSVAPEALRLSAPIGSFRTQHQLEITSLGGTVNWAVSTQILSGFGWITVAPESGVATDTAPSAITVEVDYEELGAFKGVFQALINMVDQNTGFVEVVPVAVTLTGSESRIELSRSSMRIIVAGRG